MVAPMPPKLANPESSTSDDDFIPLTRPLSAQPLLRHGSGVKMVLDPPELIGTINIQSSKLPSSIYKGVVPQPNRRWGSQIYEKHQRVWLGTFDTQKEAAHAYDIAAQRFRGRNATTNFRPLSATNGPEATELRFIYSRSKSEIVDMLRKHTYHEELRQNNRNVDDEARSNTCLTLTTSTSAGFGKEYLFDKVVTPSDVGKLNRLVIQKQQAEKHLPMLCKGNWVLVHMEDPSAKVWRFRYTYWNSSQSYVLTKGWSHFVKEKALAAGDVVMFQRSLCSDRKLYIDCKKTRAGKGVTVSVKEVRLFGVNIGRCDECWDVERKRNKGMGSLNGGVGEDCLELRPMKRWIGLGSSETVGGF